jgi:hypothetical protein
LPFDHGQVVDARDPANDIELIRVEGVHGPRNILVRYDL